MTKIKFKDLRPGDRFVTSRQGEATVIKLIRIHRTPLGDRYRFETTAPSSQITGPAEMLVRKVN